MDKRKRRPDMKKWGADEVMDFGVDGGVTKDQQGAALRDDPVDGGGRCMSRVEGAEDGECTDECNDVMINTKLRSVIYAPLQFGHRMAGC